MARLGQAIEDVLEEHTAAPSAELPRESLAMGALALLPALAARPAAKPLIAARLPRYGSHTRHPGAVGSELEERGGMRCGRRCGAVSMFATGPPACSLVFARPWGLSACASWVAVSCTVGGTPPHLATVDCRGQGCCALLRCAVLCACVRTAAAAAAAAPVLRPPQLGAPNEAVRPAAGRGHCVHARLHQ